MTNQNNPFGNNQDRYAHPYLNDYRPIPSNPYGASGRPSGPQSFPSGIRTMRSIVLWAGLVIAVSSIIFQISQMDDSLISISNVPAVAYFYIAMYFTHPYIMLAVAYAIVWLTSIRGRGYEKQKHTWLLVGAFVVIVGRLILMTLGFFFTIFS